MYRYIKVCYMYYACTQVSRIAKNCQNYTWDVCSSLTYGKVKDLPTISSTSPTRFDARIEIQYLQMTIAHILVR